MWGGRGKLDFLNLVVDEDLERYMRVLWPRADVFLRR